MAFRDSLRKTASALADVREFAGIDPREMVQLLDIMIADLAANRPQTSYSIAGRSVAIRSLTELHQLRRYYDDLAKEGTGGGIVPQYGEFF